MITVALVEDSASMRRNLERMLRRARGVRCVCACGTAEEALEQIPRAQPDVVLMDINLPGASGIECTARLKLRMPAMQVIMLTVYEDTANIFSALKAGACGYLLKRASPGEILEALTTVQTGGAPMTSEIARKIVMTFQSPTPGAGDGATLSAREQEILELLSQGKVSKEIADQLAISYHTVRVHTKHIYEKLHVRSRSEAVLKFMADKSGLPGGAPNRPPSI
ncbi:MAG: response regulator transcription factor [Verrucomicrobia bacterium]|nr:response regulator transcription factor [Verrucomicrobiota bacterium]